MADLLSLFRSNIDGVRGRRKKIQGDIELARRQREQLRTVPLPAEEIVDILMELLDRRSAGYQMDVARVARDLAHDFIVHGAQSPGAVNAGILMISTGQGIDGRVIEAMFAFLARDLVRASLLKAIKSLGLKHGSSRAERAKQLAQIEERIKDLEAQEAEIENELDAFRKEIDGRG